MSGLYNINNSNVGLNNTSSVEQARWEKKDEGVGPSNLVKLCSVIVTIATWVFGRDVNDAMGNKGKQIGGIQFTNYIGNLKNKEKNFEFISDYVSGKLEYEDRLKINNQIRAALEKNSEKPIFIPLVLGSNGLIEAAHIVALVIDPKNKKIEYFDSKGVIAGNRLMDKEEHTMGAFLKEATADLDYSYEIVQNKITQQFDVHNCGAFVACYAKNRFDTSQENPIGVEAINTSISYRDIQEIRSKMKIAQ